jgi:Rrf2 family protein
MKLSTKGRYGTRAMLDLAMHQDNGPVNLKEMAQRQIISRRYLEHLMSRLVSAGLVRSVRGRSGGFVLAREPSEITLAEVVEALEGQINVVECTADPSTCNRASECVTRDVWDEVSKVITRHLASITLDDLRMRQQERMRAGTAMYYI